MPAENIQALRGIGYFDIVKPRDFGGYEYDFDVLVDLEHRARQSLRLDRLGRRAAMPPING